MESQYKLHLPESHVNILRVVSAIAWADGNLSEEESDLLINEFNQDLPPDPSPLIFLEDTPPLFSNLLDYPEVSEQLSQRISGELALKEILVEYKYKPIPLPILVDKLKTEEDRCLALKLAYMVMTASSDESEELVTTEEKKVYRQLVNLLNLKEDLVKEIELQANEDLEEFQHPFQAFISHLKKAIGLY